MRWLRIRMMSVPTWHSRTSSAIAYCDIENAHRSCVMWVLRDRLRPTVRSRLLQPEWKTNPKRAKQRLGTDKAVLS